jgi:hypothetical protein
VSSLLDFAELTGKSTKDCRVASNTISMHQSLLYCLRRVPKLLTGSARVMLTEGNFRQRRFSKLYRVLGLWSVSKQRIC